MATLPPPMPLKQDSNLRGMAVLSISLITFALAANLVFLRMYVRIKRHVTGWDDYTICVALALSLLGTVVDVYQVANGAGRHIETLTPAQLSAFIKWTFVEGVEFVIGTCFVKISVCIFILRFINKTRRVMRYFIYILMAFLILSTVGLVIALLAQCRPLKALYDLEIKGKCYSKNVSIAVAYVQSGISVFTDFTCAGLPFFVIRKLQMKRSTKIGLSIIMGLGVFTACFSVLRIGTIHYNYSTDVTYDTLVNVAFAVLEMNLGVIAASIATIRPLFANLEPTARRSPDNTRGPYSSTQRFVRYPEASKAGSKPKSIPLSPLGTTSTTTKIEMSQNSREASEERGSV